MLSKYVHIKDPANNSVDYILCTEYPYIIGKAVQFRAAEEMEAFKAKPIAHEQVKGYKIIILFHQLLHGHNMRQIDDLQAVLSDMATDYLTNRIKPRESRFKRYREALEQ